MQKETSDFPSFVPRNSERKNKVIKIIVATSAAIALAVGVIAVERHTGILGFDRATGITP